MNLGSSPRFGLREILQTKPRLVGKKTLVSPAHFSDQPIDEIAVGREPLRLRLHLHLLGACLLRLPRVGRHRGEVCLAGGLRKPGKPGILP